MANRVLKVRSGEVTGASLREGIAKIQQELKVSPEFPDDVEQAAKQAAANPRLPELDRTDLPFVTIDPPGAMDLDQAMHLERAGDGYTVFYAIADVAAFITPGDPVDVEANQRGETLYGADSKIPLHPKAISEDAGSLLPDQVRPALLWKIDLDATGEGTAVHVERAQVRSRAKLSYDQVQQAIDEGRADEVFMLLKEIGELRLAKEEARGGVSLPRPQQEVDIDGDTWRLEFRAMHPVEEWNAQISLLTGMGAASLMVAGRVGLLRTLPPAAPRDVERLQRTARALKVDWPEGQDYAGFIRALDPTKPNHAAMVVASTTLLRGAAYAGFNGDLPEHSEQSALAAAYAHVTAPLRRLGDRYAGEICLALCAGEPVPDWVLERLDTLPGILSESGRRASQYENAVLNLVESAVLAPRVGETFTGVIVELDEKSEPPGSSGDITIEDPAIEARVVGSGRLPVGEEVSVRLIKADVGSREVVFELSS